MARNIRLYPLFLACTYESFSNAVWYLYLFSYKGLSLEQMAWLTLLGDGVIAICEVPTGYLADKLGRRASMLTGIALQIASFFLFIYGGSFLQYWLAMAVCGLGDTFRNGADRALLYDSSLALDQSARYRRVLGHSIFLATLVLAVGAVAGGVLAHRFFWELPFWIDIGLSSIGFVVVLLMREAPSGDHERDSPPPDAPATDGSVPAGLAGAGLKKRAGMRGGLLPVLPVLTLAMLFSIAPELSHFHLPAELSGAISLSTETLGWLYAAFILLEALGSKFGANWGGKASRSLFLSAVAMAVLLAAAGTRAWSGIWVYLAVRALMDLLYAFAEPIYSEAVNRLVASRIRATALSWLNAVRLCIPLAVLPFSAELVDSLGYAAMYGLLAAGMLVLVLPAGWWLLRQRVAAALDA